MGRSKLRGLEVAGVRVAVEVPSPFDWRWPRSMERFAVPPCDPEVHIGVRVGSCEFRLDDPVVYECGQGSLEVARDGRDWLVVSDRGDGLRRLARFDASFSQGEVVVSPRAAADGIHPLCHPIDEVLLLHRIAHAGGLVLHGSAVVRDRRALAFVGSGRLPGEAGPRSANETLDGAHVLAAGRVVLRPGSLGVRAHATPWSGDPGVGESGETGASQVMSAGLEAVHVLGASEEVAIEPLDAHAAVAELLAYVVAPVHAPGIADRLMENATRITHSVRVLRVETPDDRRVQPFAWGQRHASLAFAPPS